jgi:hypothetical protein
MSRISSFVAAGAAALLLLLGSVSPAAASTITCNESFLLSSLLDGGSITVGDKLFDQFTYLSTGDMPDADNVNVAPIQDSDGNFGLRFQGGFLDVFDGDPNDPSDAGNPSDALIGYRVTVLDPAFLISDVRLAGNPVVIGPPGATSGLIGVSETFLPDDLLILAIFDIEPGNSNQLVDSALLTTPLRTLHVQKDIIAFADAQGSAATLSFVDQTFSQVVVPEPSTISLLVLGLGATVWAMRRKSGPEGS